MNRKVSLVMSFILLFSFVMPIASYANTSEEDLLKEIQLELDLLDENIKSLEDGETDLEPWIDQSIKESEDLEEDSVEISNFSLFGTIGDKINNIKSFIDRQYDLKSKYIANSKETYNQSKLLKEKLSTSYEELNKIFNEEDNNLSEKDFYLILSHLKSINIGIKNSNYERMSILNQSRNYIGLVLKLELKKATDVFEDIVYLQIDRLEILYGIDSHIDSINEILLYR